MTLYIDGVEAASTTTNVDVTLNDTSQVLRVGGENTGTYDYQGYISNLRILNGTALYTSDFTVPTQELEVIGDTVLLCCNTPDSAGAEATGNALSQSMETQQHQHSLQDSSETSHSAQSSEVSQHLIHKDILFHHQARQNKEVMIVDCLVEAKIQAQQILFNLLTHHHQEIHKILVI